MQKAVIVLVVLALILLLFGCTVNSSVENMARKNPQIKEFLEQHPEATISIDSYNLADLREDYDLVTLDCSSALLIDAYYIVTVEDINSTYKALFDKANMNLVCGVIKNHITILPENESIPSETTDTQNTNTIITNPCNMVEGIIKCNTNEVCVEETIATYKGINYNCGCSKCKAIIVNTTEQTCNESWFCGNWSDCVNNSQTRTSVEISTCETEGLNKPSEQQAC